MFYKIYLAVVLVVIGIPMVPVGYLMWILTFWCDKRGSVVFWYSRIWGYFLTYLNPFNRIKVRGGHNVDKKQTYIIVSNHGSLMDIPLVYNLPLNFRWVSKREVLRMPIVGWALWLQHGITIARGTVDSTKKMLRDGQELLDKRISIAIFPEGTRSKTGRVEKFHAGAFMMASRAGVPILPLVINGAYQMMNEKDFDGHFTVDILPPISAEEVKSMKVGELALKLNEMIKEKHKTLVPQYYLDGKFGAE